MIRNDNGYLIDEHGQLVHRNIYVQVHGPIPIGWEVHHINGTKDDNAIDNLIAVPEHVHWAIHYVAIRYQRARKYQWRVQWNEWHVLIGRQTIEEWIRVYAQGDRTDELLKKARACRTQKELDLINEQRSVCARVFHLRDWVQPVVMPVATVAIPKMVLVLKRQSQIINRTLSSQGF